MSERFNIPLPLIVANHKENLTLDKVRDHFEGITEEARDFKGTLVICPTDLFVHEAVNQVTSRGLTVGVGLQDVSRFTEGAHTGETGAGQLKDGLEKVKFCIIGHSERRIFFDEDDNVLDAKVKNAQAAGLEVIFCVRGLEDKIPGGVRIVAYEPVFAIGTGNAATPQNAAEVAKAIKQKGDYIVLYGGSVTAENVRSFLPFLDAKPEDFEDYTGPDGVLIGGGSLKAETLVPILQSIS